MAKTTNPNPRIDEALLELAQGGLLSKRTADKITMRVIGGKPAKPADLSGEDIRKLRKSANISQAVLAGLLNVTTGYVAQLERGAKKPTGAALALLHVIKRKGIEAII